MLKIIRVNLKQNAITIENTSKNLIVYGGRSFISKIMEEEVDPTCEPLGPENKLIIAPGLVAGTTVSCVNRISIGGKSPLTGTIKESNAGGTTAYKLGRLGIKAIIFEELPQNNDLKILHISKDKVELIPANYLKEKGVYETGEILKDQFGKSIGIVVIGPAGERKQIAAGIANGDNDGIPSRYSGRGGLGAVMGSKGIKAIVIDDKDVGKINFADEELFNKTRKEISQTILTNEAVANSYTKFGTANLVMRTNSMGALPTKNFSTGSFDLAEEISGQKLHDLITERKGEGSTSHSCMPGCLIRCSNIFPDKNGKTIVSPIEYETIGLMGSNCGIGDLDIIGRLNYLCNDIGLDTIEMGGTIGVAMEAGVINFGDGLGAIKLLEEIRDNTYLGKILASGALITGKVLGVRRIPVVKGQVIAAYDPRAIKGLGVTYATSTMGADHTAGQTLRAKIDHLDPDGQVEASRNAQVTNMIHDFLGTCMFVGSGINNKFELLINLLKAMHGINLSIEDLFNLSKEALIRERRFNEKAGFTSAHDKLPEFFYTEANPVTGTLFDVSKEDMEKIHEF